MANILAKIPDRCPLCLDTKDTGLFFDGRAPDRRLKQVFVLSDEGQQPAFEPPEPNIQTDEPPVELPEPGAQTDESAAEPAQPDAQTGEPAATPGAETPR